MFFLLSKLNYKHKDTAFVQSSLIFALLFVGNVSRADVWAEDVRLYGWFTSVGSLSIPNE